MARLRGEPGIVSLREEVLVYTIGVPEPRGAAVDARSEEKVPGARVLSRTRRVSASPRAEILILIRGVG